MLDDASDETGGESEDTVRLVLEYVLKFVTLCVIACEREHGQSLPWLLRYTLRSYLRRFDGDCCRKDGKCCGKRVCAFTSTSYQIKRYRTVLK